MGQKVNPTGLRLGISQPCYSCWYASDAYYSFFLNEDQCIRKLISQVNSDGITTKTEIARRGNSLRLRIFGSQINSFRGPPYKSLKKLQAKLRQECLRVRLNYFCRSHFTRSISEYPSWNLKMQELEVQIFVHELRNPEQFSSYVASRIGKELEQRVPFRRVLRFREQQARDLKNVRGIRVQISGRLNGAEIARTEWTRNGRVPLHTICANIDYSSKAAHTIYGLLGIKVWIFRHVEDRRLCYLL
jgi:small subunit ribosomal protein S3